MQFTFSKIPDTVEEFKSMPNFSLKNPHSTAALFLIALCKYVDNKQIGIDMINVLKGPAPLSKHDEQFLRDRLMDKLYLPFSYFDGATPANNYTPNKPLILNTYDDTIGTQQEGYERVFVSTPGADSKRYIQLRKKGDEFFLWDYPGILSGIRIPAKDDPWA